MPPKPIRELRDLTWYRKALIRERASEANRLQKTLEDAGIKLASVATGVLGVSGRLMLDALASGTRDPEVLAQVAKGALRKKIPALEQALAGTFKPHHTLIVSHILAHLVNELAVVLGHADELALERAATGTVQQGDEVVDEPVGRILLPTSNAIAPVS